MALMLTCHAIALSQEYFIFTNDCHSSTRQIHINQNGDAFLLVSEHCSDADRRTYLCVPNEDGSLEPVNTFEMEHSEADYSTAQGWYVLFSTSTGFILRLLNDEEIMMEQEVQIPENSLVTNLYVEDDFLISVYHPAPYNQLIIERFNLTSGESESQLSFENVLYVHDHQTTLITDNDPYFYLGQTCNWRIKFNPLNFPDHEVLPLPISSQTGDQYNPCSGYDALYSHPSQDTLFAASALLGTGETHWTFYFDNDGNYMGYDELEWPDDYNPYRYLFDANGYRYIVLHKPEYYTGNNTNDLVLYKVNPSGALLDTFLYETPELSEVTLTGLFHDGILHRLGYDLQSPLMGDENALYIRIDTDNLTNVEEPAPQAYTFIQTEDAFGISTKGEPLQQDVYSMTGQLLFSEKRADLWPKSKLPPGTYVLRVASDEGVRSHLVVVR